MGQKTHPRGFRLGIVAPWKSWLVSFTPLSVCWPTETFNRVLIWDSWVVRRGWLVAG